LPRAGEKLITRYSDDVYGGFFMRDRKFNELGCPLIRCDFDLYLGGVICTALAGLERMEKMGRNKLVKLSVCAKSAPTLGNQFLKGENNMTGERWRTLPWGNRGVVPRRRTIIVAGLCALALSITQSVRAQSGYTYNYPPYAQNDNAMTMEEMPMSIAVLNNDYGMTAPLNPASVQVVTPPQNGAVVVDPSTGNAWYFPDDGFYGSDAFTYVVSNANGQISNVATVSIYVMPQPPMIENLSAVPNGDGTWFFTGKVVDLHPAGITVNFSGVVSGSAKTSSDGSFSYVASVPPASSGEVDVQATAADGLVSPIVTEYVFNR
jgi:hypothetical protein